MNLQSQVNTFVDLFNGLLDHYSAIAETYERNPERTIISGKLLVKLCLVQFDVSSYAKARSEEN